MSHAGPASTDLLEAAAPRLPALRAPRTTVTCRDGLVACVGALGRRHEARNSWEHPAPRRQGHDDANAKAPVACHAAARGCGDPGGRSTVGVAPGRERSRRGQQGEGALDGAGRRSPRSGRASGRQPWRSCSGGGRSWCLTVSSLCSPHRRWDPFHWWVSEGGVEPPRPFGHSDLNAARLPFRHSDECARCAAPDDPDDSELRRGLPSAT